MKYLFSRIFILVTSFQFAFGIIGFGAYGNMDSFSTKFNEFGNNIYTITPSSLDNSGGIGFYLYVDALPFVDLQADVEFIGNAYDFTMIVPEFNLEVTEPMAWARASTYFSVRKKIVGISIPFLAKAQIYGGAGINSHNVTPELTTEMISKSGLLNNLDSGFDVADFAEKLGEYAKENRETFSGMHIMFGAQAKLLTLNLIANYRYTIAKDVIPGKNGFSSANIGLGIGI